MGMNLDSGELLAVKQVSLNLVLDFIYFLFFGHSCFISGQVLLGTNNASKENAQNDEETDPFGAEREDMKMEKLRRFEASSMADDLKLEIYCMIYTAISKHSSRFIYENYIFPSAPKPYLPLHPAPSILLRDFYQVSPDIQTRESLTPPLTSIPEDFDAVPSLLRSIGLRQHHLGFLLASIPTTD
ncbi:hypothetical protein KSP40_PGU004457 [Platanthera guangdongensis]|uniref:Uncharacterized protein n=1 Tax=Platanthera guangdongensis TaxID=2320717 RepID=A0ABR2LND3_9ASPA